FCYRLLPIYWRGTSASSTDGTNEINTDLPASSVYFLRSRSRQTTSHSERCYRLLIIIDLLKPNAKTEQLAPTHSPVKSPTTAPTPTTSPVSNPTNAPQPWHPRSPALQMFPLTTDRSWSQPSSSRFFLMAPAIVFADRIHRNRVIETE
ncbi:hypothetical protein GW17_00048311, partial [Ensete ventricosum]